MIRVFTLSQIYANGLAYDFFRILLAPLNEHVLKHSHRPPAGGSSAASEEAEYLRPFMTHVVGGLSDIHTISELPDVGVAPVAARRRPSARAYARGG